LPPFSSLLATLTSIRIEGFATLDFGESRIFLTREQYNNILTPKQAQTLASRLTKAVKTGDVLVVLLSSPLLPFPSLPFLFIYP
jgi:hypothetical protein